MSLLQVSQVHRRFGAVHAVQGVSFELAAGEVLALIGPNGAGKSTLFNLVNGQLRADSGRISLDGQDIGHLNPAQVWRQGVARTFQVAQVFGSMTLRQNVQTVLLSRARRTLRIWQRFDAFAPRRALALLEQVGLAERADATPAALAYGDVKRLELALALAGEPRLLLMDEPTAGMAPEQRHVLMKLVCNLARERQLAVLFTEHSMDVVFGYAQRVLVMAQGQLIAQGTPTQVQSDALVRKVYLGGAA